MAPPVLKYETLRDAITAHLESYANDLPDSVLCHEGQDNIDTANDDWVVLRDAFDEEHAFVFKPSHRSCAIKAWGAAHILPPVPAPTPPTERSIDECYGALADIQRVLYFDTADAVWDYDKNWPDPSLSLIRIATIIERAGMGPKA